MEMNHADSTALPVGFRLGDNDSRILSVARSLAAEGHDVILVTKDLPMRVKASAVSRPPRSTGPSSRWRAAGQACPEARGFGHRRRPPLQ